VKPVRTINLKFLELPVAANVVEAGYRELTAVRRSLAEIKNCYTRYDAENALTDSQVAFL